MNMTPRLDRLSAVLEGLSPRVTVRFAGAITRASGFDACEPSFLRLHLVAGGSICLKQSTGAMDCLSAPSIAALRSDCGHSLVPCADGPPPDVMCMEAHLDGPIAALLLDAFSEPLLMPLEEAEPELNLIVRLIASELAQPRCGQPALLIRAGDILFIGLLRHLLAHPRTPSGLLSGLSDPRIARALVAMHTAPHLPWKLEAMAQEAGMSRTAFAMRFREIMGHTPGNYLTHLRLSIAARAVNNGQGLKQAARQSGYSSITALSRALARRQTSPTSGQRTLPAGSVEALS